jgi:hypothetical protein
LDVFGRSSSISNSDSFPALLEIWCEQHITGGQSILIIFNLIDYQHVVRGPPVVRDGPQAVSEEKLLKKLYQTLNELKIHPDMSVLKLPSLVNFR